MAARIVAIVFIFLCTSFAWFVLGGSVNIRSSEQDNKLKSMVGQLWGTVQRQKAPIANFEVIKEKIVEQEKDGKKVKEKFLETEYLYQPIDSSDIKVDLQMEHRKKGLLWYSTYKVKFDGVYQLVNTSTTARKTYVYFEFPTQGAVYDNFKFVIGGKEIENIEVQGGNIKGYVLLEPNKPETVEISYQSQGMDEWWYDFGDNVKQVKNFSLTMNTNFDKIDFPENSISPTEKSKIDKGWQLVWKYTNLLSGVKLGMVMPKKLNPGPWVSRVTFFAPVSLFLFFFLLFILTTLRQIKVHPMNYFFIGSAFFSFHLLMAYLVDHVSITLSFIICSLISIFLVVTYMKLVVGKQFAFREIAISQFVYLVLFSYAFFFEGFTGLAITILCIITLFIVMQFTGKVDWETVFQKSPKNNTIPPKV